METEFGFGSSLGVGGDGRVIVVNWDALGGGGRGGADFDFRKRGALPHEGFDGLRIFLLAHRFDLREEKERHRSQMPGVTCR